MARSNFARCLAHVLKSEGGWSDHPSDPGGATMKGITLATYRQYRPGADKADLRRITDAEVARIYRDGYWNPVRGDDLPAGLDLVAFDAAVNSGVSRGARWLQSALGVSADGKIGPATVAAARQAHPVAVIERATGARLAWLRTLKTWPTFGKGWSRRVQSVREDAEAMAITVPVTDAAPAKPSAPAAGGIIAAILAILSAIFGRKA